MDKKVKQNRAVSLKKICDKIISQVTKSFLIKYNKKYPNAIPNKQARPSITVSITIRED